VVKPVVIGIALFCSVLAGEYAWLKHQAETAPTWYQDGIASPKIKAAMKYHGILFAERLADGTLVFWRDGQRCKLFTEGFLRSWGRRHEVTH